MAALKTKGGFCLTEKEEHEMNEAMQHIISFLDLQGSKSEISYFTYVLTNLVKMTKNGE